MKTILLTITLIIYSQIGLSQCEDLADCLTEVQSIDAHQNVTDCPENDVAGDADQNSVEQEESRIRLDPNSWKYLTAGVASAPLVFLVGVAVHEGSHCGRKPG